MCRFADVVKLARPQRLSKLMLAMAGAVDMPAIIIRATNHHIKICRCGETGIHAAFRALWKQFHVGSSPTIGTLN